MGHGKAKKALTYVAAAFALFYLFSRPASAAAAVDGVFNGIITGANQLAVFFNAFVA
ncbi:hypothetical protein ACBJ59_36715 [Nonomuraea sp. MTCD27]|uniref:hypothetical protein n=1 Tax=Nonomuraea sp. MTCD27 TaxID=1676747 RepID=UPI0035BFC06A